MNKRHI